MDESYLGKSQKVLTVASNLETDEPLWFGTDRKEETLGEFFRSGLSAMQRGRMTAACLDMREPFTNKDPEVGSGVPDRVRQVPRDAARQPGCG